MYNEATRNKRPETKRTNYTKQDTIKPKILIIANHHGKNLARSLALYTNMFVIEAIIKSDATDTELMKTAIKHSQSYTKHDFILLWPSTLQPYLVDKFIQKVKNEGTNPIILTQPYQYNNGFNNMTVYLNNLSVCKELNSRQMKIMNVIECNGVLRKSNYNRNREDINKVGKKFLARFIINHINDYFLNQDGAYTSTPTVNPELNNM
ncbi:hypothetical protein JTB14_027770 [Gonioctena quinquepunctata]|nr:hypothetical protein JTB14_027770 [Gonioctena quinquepunctata]